MNDSLDPHDTLKSIPGYKPPFYARTGFLLTALLIGSFYAYGWRVTEIDPREMFRDFHLVKPLAKALLQPDLFTANRDFQSAEADFILGSMARHLSKSSPVAGSGLQLSHLRGNIGDPIMVSGSGMKPNTEGKLIWINSIEQELFLVSILTDSQGEFSNDIRVPDMARGDKQRIKVVLSWKTGGWQISRTLKLAVEKMVETVFLALMATSFALLVAIPLSFLGARNIMTGSGVGTAIYYGVRTFFNILRSVEPLVLAILFAVWVGIGPFAGVLALGFHSIAALGKLYSEQIESIDQHPVEAVTSTGATRLQVLIFAVVPQVFPQFLAFTFYRWDINVRMSTIIGFVGGGGIGFLLQQWINLLQYNQAGTALLVIVLVVITLDTISSIIRERIN